MDEALRHKSIPVSGNYIAEEIPHPRESIFCTTFIFFYTVIEKRSMYKPATEGTGKSHKLWLARKQWKVSL
jgi:hypothetical protein